MDHISLKSAQLLCATPLAKLKTADPDLHAVVERLVDWAKPGESALALMGTAIENADRPWPPEVTQIARALFQHQMRLSYLDGHDDAKDQQHGEVAR